MSAADTAPLLECLCASCLHVWMAEAEGDERACWRCGGRAVARYPWSGDESISIAESLERGKTWAARVRQ